MKGFVAPTDYDWYAQLAGQPQLDEVNFWKLTERRFAALEPGDAFFFKLKAPHNAIAGWGTFARFRALPTWLAWETFGTKNGTPNLSTLESRLVNYRRKNRIEITGELRIGCIVVVEPMLFAPHEWVKQPSDWAPKTQSGAVYEDLSTGEGNRILMECIQRGAVRGGAIPIVSTAEEAARYAIAREVRVRLGQGAFRVAVTDAYEGRCAITGERSLPVLDAAHIKPYADGGTHDLGNGLMLRSDLHRLFDHGYVTIDDNNQLRVSRSLRDHYENGRHYYEMEGVEVRRPKDVADWPRRELLRWHNEAVFQR